MVIPTKGCRVLTRFKIRTQWRLLNVHVVAQKCCSSSYKNLLHWVKFLLINPWDYEIFGAGVISLRPLQNSPNVFIPQLFSDSCVTALVILLQRGHTADGAA